MFEWLGPAMFAGALLLLAFGYPVAFSLGERQLFLAFSGSRSTFSTRFLSRLYPNACLG